MYAIEVDTDKNLIYIRISGSLQIDVVKAYIIELIKAFELFQEKQALVLVDAERMDPVSQNCFLELSKATEYVIRNSKKVAAIHKRTITRMQAKRIEQEVNKKGYNDIKIMRFSTKLEAMEYLTTDQHK